jgi:hypothetical protein
MRPEVTNYILGAVLTGLAIQARAETPVRPDATSLAATSLIGTIPAVAAASLRSNAIPTDASAGAQRPSPAAPQVGGPSLNPGQRVRITAVAPGRFSGVTTGTLVKNGPDTMTVIDTASDSVIELPLDAITRIQVGSKRRQTKKGLLIGAAFGAIMAIGTFEDSSNACFDTTGNVSVSRPCTSSEKKALGASLFAISATGGALYGYSRQSEVWMDTSVERIKVSAQPLRGGGRLGLAFSF